MSMNKALVTYFSASVHLCADVIDAFSDNILSKSVAHAVIDIVQDFADAPNLHELASAYRAVTKALKRAETKAKSFGETVESACKEDYSVKELGKLIDKACEEDD
jgi:hypothetical protein